MKDKEVIVQISSLSKTYKIGQVEIKALQNIHLNVCNGELTAICGPSGAGKTTLLDIIGGIESPTSGNVMVLGQDLGGCDEEYLATFRCAYIGFVFQSYNLISTLTAFENVSFPMELAKWPQDHIQKRSQELLELVGLSHRSDHFPSQLSGGEQQRTAFARALSNNPVLILADEPTGNLDSNTAMAIVKILKKLKADGKTQIVATHDQEIMQLANDVVKIEEGRIVHE